MMGFIKSALLSLLGQEKYLFLTSKIFFLFFKNGWLRQNPSYYTHYMAEKLVAPGATVIDIGANLGYYACLFARKTGPTGKVYAVEPISVYRKVLQHNTAPYAQVTILPYALGEKEGILKMGNPSADRHRHGLMRVLKENETPAENVYEVPVKNPAELFSGIAAPAYIKCDIEGYEVPVIPAMRSVIAQHRPILQIETEGENKKIIFAMLAALDYRMYFAGASHLQVYDNPEAALPGDLIAIPAERIAAYQNIISHGTS